MYAPRRRAAFEERRERKYISLSVLSLRGEKEDGEREREERMGMYERAREQETDISRYRLNM